MKYFELRETIELCFAGRIPQARKTDNCVFGSPFSSVHITLEQLPKQIPLLELELVKGAKTTDILSSYSLPFGLLVSSKLRDLLREFNLPPHRFHQINLIDRGILRNDYFWFHCFDDLWKYLDSSRCTLEIFHRFKRQTLQEVPIISYQQLRDLYDSLEFEQDMRLKELYFSEDIPLYDVMQNNIFGLGTWISERLKRALESEGITGYDMGEVAALREWGKEQGAQSQGLK